MRQTTGMGGVRDERRKGIEPMGWSDFHRRRATMERALTAARHTEGNRIPFDRIAGAREDFGTEEGLLLALQHRWWQILTGHLRAEVAGPEDADTVPGDDSTECEDHVDAVSRAWRAAVRRHPALHAVVSANVERFPSLRRAHDAELRMLALVSGLAEPHEPDDEVVGVGATLVALFHERALAEASDPGSCPAAEPVAQWLRRLAPTA